MINLYDYGASAHVGTRYHATVTIRVTEHWHLAYEAYEASEEAAIASIRKQIKSIRRALKRADLEASPCVNLSE